MPAVQTIGPSPKKIAATITALAVPYLLGFVGDRLGFEVDVSTATAIVGPVVLAACTYVAAHLARPGKVYVDQTLYPDAFTGPNPPARVRSQEAPTLDDEAAKKRSEASRKAAATRKRNKARK